MFGNLSQFASLMKNAKEIQSRAQEMTRRLGSVQVQGAAGGGMVNVVATADQKIQSIRIESSLLTGGDKEFLEDLVASAVNQALDNAREEAARQMSELTGGLGLPDIQEAMSKFGFGK